MISNMINDLIKKLPIMLNHHKYKYIYYTYFRLAFIQFSICFFFEFYFLKMQIYEK